MKKSLLLVMVICSLGLLGGCGGGAGNPPPPVQVATHLSVTSANATPTAGTAFNITVTALDAMGSTVTSYSGTVHFSSSDGQAVLPASVPVTNGTATASVTLKTAGSQTVTVTGADLLTGLSSAIPVGPAAASTFSASPAAATDITGTPFNFTVTALDPFSNTATTYAGTVHFSSTDGSAVLPSNSTLSKGTGTFAATLKTSGSQTITATDTVTASITGSFAISASGQATHFSFSGQAAASTRRAITMSVSALDASNNGAIGYNGTVQITSSDGGAILPGNATLQAGSANFQITLETPGNQTITATDTVAPSIKGTSSAITVTATAPLAITSGAPPDGTVASTYGPTTTTYSRCVFNFQLNHRVCQPCVPNTFACGGSPTNPYPSCRSRIPSTETCVSSVTFSGFQLAGTGGVPPYSFAATSLPPGLSIVLTFSEYLIHGTPSSGSAGTYNAMVTLSDAGMPPAPNTVLYPIIIHNPPPPVISVTPAPSTGAVNLPYSFTFTAASAEPPLSWRVSAGTPPAGLAFSGAGVLSGTPTTAGNSSMTLIAQDSVKQDSAPQAFTIDIFAHGFKATGSLAAARFSHTATLLNTGKVLVAGGTDPTGKPLASAELYDPAAGTFSSTGSMLTARADFAATLLPSGKVLVTGGLDANGNPLQTAELYDPGAGTFSATPSGMQFVHASHTATLLNTGKVLIAGWGNAVAELFDPVTVTFAQTGSMVKARVSHTATLLSTGKVLVTGGIQGTGATTLVLSEAELYDPGTGAFSPTLGSMATARQWHSASLLAGDKVLVTGGLDINNKAFTSAELFDPGTLSFAATANTMATARGFHTATVLQDGTVLVAGGNDGAVAVMTAETFDPTAKTFSPTGGMADARQSHTATLLPNGRVLVTGGISTAGVLATAELYQ